MTKTWSQKPSEVQRNWNVLDASGKPLGRLASVAAKLLMGKDKPQFTPHVMGGDFVIVINSDKIQLTGKKWTQKIYYKHSRFVGSLKEQKAKDMTTQELIRKAVQGMLPKNSHRPRALKRLKIFKDSQHYYQDKKPKELSNRIKKVK